MKEDAEGIRIAIADNEAPAGSYVGKENLETKLKNSLTLLFLP